jgi:hypothetical protein
MLKEGKHVGRKEMGRATIPKKIRHNILKKSERTWSRKEEMKRKSEK